MPVQFGTNVSETIFGGADDDVLNGWDIANLPGDEGPADDNDILVAGDGVDTLNGGAGHDVLYGQVGSDILNGGAASDDLYGGFDTDTLNGGDGADNIFVEVGDGFDKIDGGADTDYLLLDRTASSLGLTFSIATPSVLQTLQDSTSIINMEWMTFRGGSGDDVVTGGSLNDQLYGNDGLDSLTGGTGDDYLVGDLGNDTLNGGDDKDVLIGGANQDTLDGGNGDDYVTGGDDVDNVSGGAGVDQVYGGLGNDSVNGGSEDDFIFVDAAEGNDSIDGGDGADYLYFNRSGSSLGLTFSLGNSALQQVLADGTTIINVERMFFTGGSGVDTVTGGGLDDLFVGGGGNDVLAGGAGLDMFTSGAGADSMDGGEGSDTVDYRLSVGSNISINLLTGAAGIGGDAAGDILTTVENLYGSFLLRDILVGNNDGNTLKGFGGNDSLRGEGGDDYLEGGTGADALNAGAGSGDWAGYRDNVAGNININLTTHTASGGDAQGDTLFFVENLEGSLVLRDILVGDVFNNVLASHGGNDSLRGEAGNDFLDGGDGADSLNGGAGIDTVGYDYSTAGVTVDLSAALQGGEGQAAGDSLFFIENITGSAFDDSLTGNIFSNRLVGGAGADTLNGALGSDYLTGGLGADTFRFQDLSFGSDTILDWEDGVDKISVALPLETSFSGLTFTGNGTSHVVVRGFNGTGSAIIVKADAGFTLDAGDFVFV